MRRPSLPLLALAVLPACTSPPGSTAPPASANWQGELRILPGDTTFMPCGAHKAFRITGPGLDSLARRYAWLRTVPGQWIKTWCSGYLAEGPQGTGDSLLVATAYAHMDPDVYCPPVPADSLAGTWRAQSAIPGGTRTEELVFLPGGEATIYATSNQMQAEVDGRWGLDSDGSVVFAEADGRYMLLYAWEHGMLVRLVANGRPAAEYRRAGPAVRMRGAFGRTARWLAAVASANGHPMQAEDLRPAMRLDSLFPGAARAALDSTAGDTLQLTPQKVRLVWGAASTVRDATWLMRQHAQAPR